MAKSTFKPRIKELIHRCGNFMYVIPSQEQTIVPEEIEAYMITFDNPWKKLPSDVSTSNHQFCPYCGTQLYIETTEGER